MVFVYTQESCVQCTATTRALGKYKVPYEARPITEHPDVLQEARDRGMLTAPYVVHGDRRWSGFNLTEIRASVPA